MTRELKEKWYKIEAHEHSMVLPQNSAKREKGLVMVQRCIAMWMKAMCSERNADSTKMCHSTAVKHGHENGRINPHGDLTALFQHCWPCTCKIVRVIEQGDWR